MRAVHPSSRVVAREEPERKGAEGQVRIQVLVGPVPPREAREREARREPLAQVVARAWRERPVEPELRAAPEPMAVRAMTERPAMGVRARAQDRVVRRW